jgi:divalent metal cation (Fe/Co/Zn/Cd) transporter
MTDTVQAAQLNQRHAMVTRGKRLEYFTVIWNFLEGVASVLAGFWSGSVSLVGFGMDSFIEVTSGAVVLWRMSVDEDAGRRKHHDHRALQMVGVCFLGLAGYLVFRSVTNLIDRKAPEHSLPGIVIAALSLVVMPMLSRAKTRVAVEIGSRAMRADARQTDFCTYLSAILLAGLLLNSLLGWWWADSVVALLMVPIIGNEGLDGIKGKVCCDEALEI